MMLLAPFMIQHNVSMQCLQLCMTQCSYCSAYNALLIVDPPLPLHTPFPTAPLEALTFGLPGHEGITRSGRGTNTVETVNLLVKHAMSFIAGPQLVAARLWGILTYINIKAGKKNKGDPDRRLFDMMRMKVLEELAQLLNLPRMFPEHNMQPTSTPEFMLTRSLDAPKGPPEVRELQRELQHASTPIPPPSHSMSEQDFEDMADVMRQVLLIQGMNGNT